MLFRQYSAFLALLALSLLLAVRPQAGVAAKAALARAVERLTGVVDALERMPRSRPSLKHRPWRKRVLAWSEGRIIAIMALVGM